MNQTILRKAGFSLIAVVAWLLPQSLSATEAASMVFTDRIEPILRDQCFDCHGADKQKNQLRLDRRSDMLRGGDSGEPAVVPGHPGQSYLLRKIRTDKDSERMPPKGPGLDEDQIKLIADWIEAGAVTPESYGPDAEETSIDHWAFLAVPEDFPIPTDYTGSPIDFFIGRRLKEKGLDPSPEASATTLIRRAYMVLHGLPAPPEVIRSFVADQSEGKWERTVDSLLSHPAYGEKWASHWLDVARFGETHGFETNRERPHAWHYRDWVIEAINHDMPYDRFVKAQIAGDVIGEPVGTSFLVAGPNDIVKGQDPKLGPMQRMNELDDMINTTGTAFLGLTLGCARCHNHKFDPVSQKDYYAIQAVFAGVQHGDRMIESQDEDAGSIAALTDRLHALGKELDNWPSSGLRDPVSASWNEEKFNPTEARVLRFVIHETSGNAEPCIDEIEIYQDGENIALAHSGVSVTSSGDFEHPLHKLGHINDGRLGNSRSWIAATRGSGWVQFTFPETVSIDRIVWARDRQGQFSDRLPVEYEIMAGISGDSLVRIAGSHDRLPPGSDRSAFYARVIGKLDPDERGRATQILRQWEKTKLELRELTQPVKVYAGLFEQPGPTHRLYRGEPDAPREQVGPDTVQVLGRLGLTRDSPEQDRRLALARWIASDENPLTARVMVNRIWQFHFGRGLIDTPNDFGRNGVPPSHPQLLDWLACEFMNSGWSMKHVHRLILTSKTWKQSSLPTKAGMQADAGTVLLWRYPTRRLDAEGIRDSILSVAGTLNSDAGGPGFSAFEVELENVRHYHPRSDYGPEEWRRMIYMTKVRQEKDSVFGAFDCPDASQVIPKRSRSTTPIQALNLLNSRFVTQQASLYAARLQKECGDDLNAVIRRAWMLSFGRNPGQEESAMAVEFASEHGLDQLTRALLNANEFLFIP